MSDYSNKIKSGTAIETWREARDDAELQSLTSGDTYTLTLESDTEDSATCTWGSGDWAGVHIVIKSDVKYTKRFSFMRTAGSPSGDEQVTWDQGSTGTLDMSDVCFDHEADGGPFGHIRYQSSAGAEQKYERVGFFNSDSTRGINNPSSFGLFINCMFAELGNEGIQVTSGTDPAMIYCTSNMGSTWLASIISDNYDGETKNILASSMDADHNDIATDADYVGTADTTSSQFTNNAQSKAFDTTRFESVTYSVANINNGTYLQIKNHTSVAGMFGLAGVAPTAAEPTDDFYGNVRDTGDRDLGATAIAAAGGAKYAQQHEFGQEFAQEFLNN